MAAKIYKNEYFIDKCTAGENFHEIYHYFLRISLEIALLSPSVYVQLHVNRVTPQASDMSSKLGNYKLISGK